MKSSRQIAILELISSGQIGTQEDLAELLSEKGFQVTQATVSRDIKELRLIKKLSPDGSYFYSLPEKNNDVVSNDRLLRMFSSIVLSMESAYNQIVIKTMPGSANVAAEMIDNLQMPEIIGTIAGDNTILLICRNIEEVPNVLDRLKDMTED